MRQFRGGQIQAFGSGKGKIQLVLIINLDRQPDRLRRTMHELSRFKTADGNSLSTLARRLVAVDARDGRAVAATADVDPNYRLGDQLHVQPDSRLEESFGVDEPVRMTRQEVAVAKSHIEAWKVLAEGTWDNVLILEDDVWFRAGAAAAIDRGWHAAVKRCSETAGPRLLYLSYADANGTAKRVDVCCDLFRPERGLWFLSGYVLSKQAAKMLLKAMPVIGPVDMWMNYRFHELGALALSSPAILQRSDAASSNYYSVLPYLARAGIVDASAVHVPGRKVVDPVLAWTTRRGRDGLAMALSMLGLRVRVFDGGEQAIGEDGLPPLFETFDALIDAPLSTAALSSAISKYKARLIFEDDTCCQNDVEELPISRKVILPKVESRDALWQPICALLDLNASAEIFPNGPRRERRVFRDDRVPSECPRGDFRTIGCPVDESPWAIIPSSDWPSEPSPNGANRAPGKLVFHAAMTTLSTMLPARVETFPGNLAEFGKGGVMPDSIGTHLVLRKSANGNRPYRSGSFSSMRSFKYGRFQTEIKAARGSGLVTGFFLHRASPRQEIDLELIGNDPHTVLVNVYFNPGDEGAALDYGYRGSPCRIELGFDSSLDFHLYAVEWRPGYISWSVDGRVVHERVGWDPTPVPHLPMQLHANLWAPRSGEVAGRMDESKLPSTAIFRNLSIRD